MLSLNISTTTLLRVVGNWRFLRLLLSVRAWVFFWYNTYPAQVFMGDIGSLSLGGALGTLAFLTKHELLMIIIGGLFVVEALSRHCPSCIVQTDRQTCPKDGTDSSPL